MPEIELDGAHAGTVTVEDGALSRLSIPGPLAVIVDAGLPEHWRREVVARLSPLVTVEVPARDESKTLEVLASVLSRLAGAGLTRDGAVLGLGGGATTDLAGFAAACYLRGVRSYSAPTTLLGMVDAAVGGKTGVNLPEGKNLVGAFWPARQVWCDPQVLETLPLPVFREGAAEAYKHGLISDPTLLLRVLSPDFAPGHPSFADTLADAIRVKAGVVTRDPTEQGERAFLNFGHTLAHAIEGATHGAMPHGFAVGYGMHYAALLSHALGGADLSAHTRRFLAWQRPDPLPELDWAELRGYMARDKKADREGVRFVLLHDVARPYLARVPEELLHLTFGTWQADLAELGLSAAVPA